MKRIFGYCFFSLALLLVYSCSNAPEETNTEGPDDQLSDSVENTTNNFNIQFNQLLTALKSKNTEKINTFLSPEYGLLIIRSSGALPSILMSNHDQKEYNSALEQLYNSVPDSVTLRNESLPKVDCGLPSFYSKTGYFIRDTNLLATSDIWKFGSLNDSDQILVEKAVLAVERIVMLVPGFTFHFIQVQDRWYLTLVDVRKPCNA